LNNRLYRVNGILRFAGVIRENPILGKYIQGNRRLHFAGAVHSHRPFTAPSHLQRTCYNALSVGKKTPKTAPFPWDFVTLPDEDRAAIVNRQTDRQTYVDVLIKILRYRSRRRSNDASCI